MILYSQGFFYHDPLPNIISIQLILQFNYTLFIMRARGFTFVTCSPIPTALIPFCFMGRELWSAFAPLFLLCFSFIIFVQYLLRIQLAYLVPPLFHSSHLPYNFLFFLTSSSPRLYIISLIDSIIFIDGSATLQTTASMQIPPFP